MRIIETGGTFVRARSSGVSQLDHNTSFIDFELYRFREGVDMLSFSAFFHWESVGSGSLVKSKVPVLVESGNIFLCGLKDSPGSSVNLRDISDLSLYSEYTKICLRYVFDRSSTSFKAIDIEPVWEKSVSVPFPDTHVLHTHVFRVEFEKSVNANAYISNTSPDIISHLQSVVGSMEGAISDCISRVSVLEEEIVDISELVDSAFLFRGAYIDGASYRCNSVVLFDGYLLLKQNVPLEVPNIPPVRGGGDTYYSLDGVSYLVWLSLSSKLPTGVGGGSVIAVDEGGTPIVSGVEVSDGSLYVGPSTDPSNRVPSLSEMSDTTFNFDDGVGSVVVASRGGSMQLRLATVDIISGSVSNFRLSLNGESVVEMDRVKTDTVFELSGVYLSGGTNILTVGGSGFFSSSVVVRSRPTE